MADRSTWPPPLIEIAVEAKTKSDQEKLRITLAALAAENPNFVGAFDDETGQAILGSADEQGLEELDARLRAASAVDLRFGAPQAAYRETITRAATIDYTHKRLTGSSGQFARVKIAFEPVPYESGFVFVNSPPVETVPAAFVPGVEKGLMAQAQNGLLAGFPLVGVKATLLDGAYHDLDSSVLTFEVAARAAVRELAASGLPVLLEPVMQLRISAPRNCLEAIYADLDRRRTDIARTVAEGELCSVTARATLSALFGYANALRALSLGRATVSMTFDRYAPIPPVPPNSDGDPHFPSAGAMRMAVPAAGPVDAIAKPRP